MIDIDEYYENLYWRVRNRGWAGSRLSSTGVVHENSTDEATRRWLDGWAKVLDAEHEN